MGASTGYYGLSPFRLGSYLRYYRLKAGLSARQLAQVTGIGMTRIYKIERGERTKVDEVEIQAVLEACGVDDAQAFTEPIERVFDVHVRNSEMLQSARLNEIFSELKPTARGHLLSVAQALLNSQRYREMVSEGQEEDV